MSQTPRPVPFVDLGLQHQKIRHACNKRIAGLIEASAFVGGQEVSDFADRFSEKLGTRHCIPVGNGTDALYIALKMMDIGPGDEVITAANSWISSAEVITRTGAKPVFADVDPGHYCIDPDDLERKRTSRTRAVIPVHLFGQMADMERIMPWARKHGILVLEDSAQAHFSSLNGKMAGTLGDAGAFSFYPSKNLGAFGDAGAIVTDNSELAERCARFANHGGIQKNEHLFDGMNSRMDAIQAAVLNIKLEHIDEWNTQRMEAAAFYSGSLSGLDQLIVPAIRNNTSHTFHLYVILTQDRHSLRQHLDERGIATALHYPTMLPLLPAYEHLQHVGSDFPVSLSLQDRILSLPMFPGITREQQLRVVKAVREFYE